MVQYSIVLHLHHYSNVHLPFRITYVCMCKCIGMPAHEFGYMALYWFSKYMHCGYKTIYLQKKSLLSSIALMIFSVTLCFVALL